MQRSFIISLSQEYYSEKVCLSQYDSDYAVNFEVLDKGAKAPINGMTAYFEGTRCDGLSFRYSGTATDNYVSFSIDTALTAVSGRHTGEIVLYDGSGLWFGSANVQIFVEKAARPDTAVDADVESQQTLLEQITTIAEQTEESANGIINMTVSAQTLAEGASATVTKSEQDGVVHLAFGIPIGVSSHDGTGGQDGYSPTVTITPITGGHRVSITDADGTETFDVMDGTNGTNGTTFTPSVSSAGVISWTNDGNKQNPSSVDLVAAIPEATMQTAGKMSAQDKSRLDDVYADYSSALTALGVI